MEFESILEGYPVKLANFEGPLDLLLHLIRKHEVDIYDIPIALVTRQYLDYIDLMQELNLDVAGEFLVMAATLIHIKSRTLLPRADPAQEDPDEDPREALIRRLLEHQKYKAAAELLHERETLRSAQWTRPDGPIAEIAGEAPEPEVDVDLFSLISAFRAVVERAKQRPKVYLPAEQIPIEDRIEQLMTRLSETEACGFEDLFADVQSRVRADRHVPGAARDDPAEAGARVPGWIGWADPRLPPGAAGRRAAPAARSRDAARRGNRSACARGGSRRADADSDAAPIPDAPNRTRSRGTDVSDHLKPIVEALIFASPDPVTPKTLYKLLEGEPREDVDAALAAVRADYDRPGGLQLVEIAGGYQIVTRPELHEWVRKLFHERTTQKLSVQSLETLAVIAYKQPITVARDRRDPRRQQQRWRPVHAHRTQVGQDRRPQAGRRPPVHVRDDAGVPRALRPERPHRSAEGRGDVRRARLRAAERAAGAVDHDHGAAVRRVARPGRGDDSRTRAAPSVPREGALSRRQAARLRPAVHRPIAHA